MIGPIPAAAVQACDALGWLIGREWDLDAWRQYDCDLMVADGLDVARLLTVLYERSPGAWALVVGVRKVPGAFVYHGDKGVAHHLHRAALEFRAYVVEHDLLEGNVNRVELRRINFR